MYGAWKTKALLPWLVLASLSVLADELDAEKLIYRRERVDRPPATRPAQAPLPGELRVAVTGEKAPQASVEASQGDLAAPARRTARSVARTLLDREGRREAYRMGFYDGLHTAFGDSYLGRWDYDDGIRQGRRSPEARRQGFDVGYAAAREAADRAAYEEVSEQFHDLSREPRPWPHAKPHPVSLHLPEVRPPDLEEVFHDYPLHGFLRRRIVEPLPDPWQFYRYRSYREFYDPRWRDAGWAFKVWARNNPQVSQQPGYREMFLYYYPRELAAIYAEVVERAFSHGFNDGWDYGASIRYEWSYRRGYCQGWNDTLRENAETAYRRSFGETYEKRYSEYFEDWATNPKPEIVSFSLSDGNDDGVFEPGEELALAYELVNYGGAPGDFTARLDGFWLTRKASAPVNLPRRAVLRSAAPLVGQIGSAVRPRTEIRLGFSVAGLDRPLALRVSYPLELGRPVRLGAHDAVAGRAEIEAVLRNTSRRAVPGEIELRGDGTSPRGVTRSFARIGAGEHRRVTFELAGLEPLELLAGMVRVELIARSSGKVHDQHPQQLPVLAVDLGNRELLRFMQHLARGAAAAPRDQVRRAQALILRRLEADWKAVAARTGNDYKSDVKQGSRTTALGDLVATYRAERTAFAHREVFTALAPRIEALAGSLPGTHPFLRRWMRKLARKLRP